MNRKVEVDGARCRLWFSPVGWLGLAAGRAGLVEVFFHRQKQQVLAHLRQAYPDALLQDNALLELAIAQLAGYFGGRSRSFDLPLDFRGLSPFAVRVLQALREVPFGQTLSYAELASLAGSPRAARAVGGVMARNPFPIIVPCHRVLGSAGKMVGYSGGAGIASKEQLLRFEQSGGET
ncbi:methylated-DNA--protein-cysteine methyltransferase [Desulfuromonas versatilis]|uniref:Methylated-DNA--protein-cysteine methyltransferase n=1 Tax=Desulfuromonas versatilis TaxID=2802975 RepID=A0ABN6DZX8_9BACT|nr:methylated-DNA--[protein]-cysteine S-methyltransferase [Desulfuromonas versatilis]BCR05109.1 methylated-DNA--protein-cysteine methyltransferase [Desulfuromonas versatilis]